MALTAEAIAAALDTKTGHPTLALLRANNRTWIIPLSADHLEQVEWVSAEWFQERVQEVLDRQVGPDVGARTTGKTASDYCRDWVEEQWLDTDIIDTNLRYSLCNQQVKVKKRFQPKAKEGLQPLSRGDRGDRGDRGGGQGVRQQEVACCVRHFGAPDRQRVRSRVR